MGLRCLLFTADESAAEPIRAVLGGLAVEGEHCAEAVDAVERVTRHSFQIVIIDWDLQPEAAQILKAARERKAAERPLTLAVVSEDSGVPQALQAGANSILRKPIQINQVKDTLTTARDLLRAKQDSAAAQAASAAASTTPMPTSLPGAGSETTLRAGEFLQSTAPAPGAQFITESDLPPFPDHELTQPADSLADLEPMAASVVPAEAAEENFTAITADTDQRRGLEYYLKTRAGRLPPIPNRASAPTTPEAHAKTERVELLGYDQAVSNRPSSPGQDSVSASRSNSGGFEPTPGLEVKSNVPDFGRTTDEPSTDATSEDSRDAHPRFRLGKRTIFAALALAACAVVAAPQAPWHGRVAALCGRGQKALHAWLNPQPVTTAQAPAAHEDFARAGDEYKLPVAENIPDATTDPAQIKVTPVTDPTAKKPDPAASANSAAQQQDAGADSAAQSSAEQSSAEQSSAEQSSGIRVAENPTSVIPGQTAVTNPAAASGATGPGAASQVEAELHADLPAAGSRIPSRPQIAPAPPVRVVSAPSNHAATNLSTNNPRIPSSLTSQIASMTPEASGNKPAETALQAIEPVNIPEAAERRLLTDQPAIGYPANAKGQQGTVVLQLLIGRDGSVQDAKFLQGSLAFARTAIDGVKQWKFKPFVMNGRPVSVQTQVSMSFKPGS